MTTTATETLISYLRATADLSRSTRTGRRLDLAWDAAASPEMVAAARALLDEGYALVLWRDRERVEGAAAVNFAPTRAALLDPRRYRRHYTTVLAAPWK